MAYYHLWRRTDLKKLDGFCRKICWFVSTYISIDMSCSEDKMLYRLDKRISHVSLYVPVRKREKKIGDWRETEREKDWSSSSYYYYYQVIYAYNPNYWYLVILVLILDHVSLNLCAIRKVVEVNVSVIACTYMVIRLFVRGRLRVHCFMFEADILSWKIKYSYLNRPNRTDMPRASNLILENRNFLLKIQYTLTHSIVHAYRLQTLLSRESNF